MNHPQPIFKALRESPGIRLTVLFGSFFVLLLFCSIFAAFLGKIDSDPRTITLIATTVQCVFAFCLPTYILAKYSSHQPGKWLFLTTKPSLKALIGVVIIYIVSIPAMEWLIAWNADMHFPEALQGLETQFRQWEEAGEASTTLLLETSGWFSALIGVLVIGVLTGFSEEMFFRGGLQGILTRTSVGTGVAVWLSAFVFSTMHFQFFGFLPRLLMGAFFGYLLVWSRSLWVPVFAHALNNSMVVIVSAITGETTSSMIESTNSSEFLAHPIPVIVSGAFTILFLVFFKESFFKKSSAKWQKNQLPPVIGR